MQRSAGIDVRKPLAVDRDMVRSVAKSLFDTYDRNKSGAIEEHEMGTPR